MAAWAGLLASLAYYELFLFLLGQQWLLWITCLANIGFMIYLSCYLEQWVSEIHIVSTTVIGSFMLMIGTNACLGVYNNVYNPFVLSELQAKGLLVTINKWYLAYLALFCLCVIVGLLV